MKKSILKLDRVCEDANKILFQTDLGNEKCFLKQLKLSSTKKIQTIFEQEINLTNQLSSKLFLKPKQLMKYNGDLFLQYDWFNSISLRDCSSNLLDYKTLVKIANEIISALQDIHQKQFVLSYLSPDNILIDRRTTQIKIFDLFFSFKFNSSASNYEFKLNPFYTAPELTERTTLNPDYRTDFYLLGILLYQLITGEYPAGGKDEIEIYHSQLAKKPITPNQINQNIPKPVSDLIMKLLEKNPADRYQTLTGLKSDVYFLSRMDKSIQAIQNFQIAMFDENNALPISDTIVPRTVLQGKISTQLNENNSGISIHQINGFAGIGKTKFLESLSKSLNFKNLLLINLDQTDSTTSFYLIKLILTKYLDQILLLNTKEILEFKKFVLNNSLGKLEVFARYVPLLNEIFQLKQRDTKKVSNEQTLLIYGNLLQLFLSWFKETTICIDNLHYADIQSLKVLNRKFNKKISDSKIELIYTYNVSANNSQNRKSIINKLQSNSPDCIYKINEFELDEIIDLLHILFSSNSKISLINLARVLQNKSMGYPQYISDLLDTLYKEKLITKSPNSKVWKYDIEAIKLFVQGTNFIGIMIHKLESISLPELNILRLGACLGETFDLFTLSNIMNRNTNKILSLLSAAIQYNLIEKVKKSDETKECFQFLNDKIRQEIYSKMTTNLKQKTHLIIGRYYLKEFIENSDAINVFELTDHFNISLLLITDFSEKLQIIRLNLLAAKRAFNKAIFKSAHQYVSKCIYLIDESFWNSQYNLVKDIYLEACEISHVVISLDESLKLIEYSLNHVRSFEEKLDFYYVKAQMLIQSNQSVEAVKLGLYILKQLGFKVSESPSGLSIYFHIHLIILKIKKMGTKRLLKMNINNHNQSYQIIRFLSLIITQVYYTNPRLVPFMISIMNELTIKYGYTEYTPNTLLMLSSFLLNIAHKNFRFALKLAQVGIKIAQTNSIKRNIYNQYIMINFIDYWRKPIININNRLLSLYDKSVRTGEYEYGALALVSYCNNLFFVGQNLETLDNSISDSLEKVQYVQQEKAITDLNSLRGMVQGLINSGSMNFVLPLKYLENNFKNGTILGKYYMMNMFTSYIFESYDEAIRYAKLGFKYKESLSLGSLSYLFHFFASLSYLSQSKLARADLKRIKNVIRKFAQYTKRMPDNIRPYYLILKAQYLIYNEDTASGIELLKKTIDVCNEKLNKLCLSIALELLAQITAKNNDELSHYYYLEAYISYKDWGALFKAKQIKENYLNKYDFALSTPNPQNNNVDILSILKFTEILSKEVRLNDVLLKLINILMENSGAMRCRLILVEDSQLMCKAVCCLKNDINSIISEEITNHNNYPTQLINESYHHKKRLLLKNASQSNEYKNYPYIKKNNTKSLLIFPINSQKGIQTLLVLENELMEGVFNEKCLSSISMLSTQIAISIENALLYETLEDKVEERMNELKKTQNQLVQAEKMSSLGILTAGIAHEMNTPLAYVKNNFQLVNRIINEFPIPDSKQNTITTLLNDCETGIQKVGEIVKGLKNFSRKDDESTQLADIAEIIKQALLICQNVIKSKQVFVETYLNEKIQLECYPAQLEQVFLNLINNSCQAIADNLDHKSEKGMLEIKLYSQEESVIISFKDNGHGINKENQSKIFDPFFTTKIVGEGTGLGLSVSYNIIKAHFGEISVISDEHSYSEFIIKLPKHTKVKKSMMLESATFKASKNYSIM